jgi:pimeloyl-ACP methyl ester carboxylesterase
MSTTGRIQDPQSGFLAVDGLRLHFLDWGGNGQPIVIVHATGFLGRIYRPIAEGLRTIGHVYSYDQRGHGDSDRPSLEAISWEHTARDVEQFIVSLGLKNVRGVGHSAGGTAIAAVAARRPDLISRAVLAEPVLIDRDAPSQGPVSMVERTLKRRNGFETIEAMFRSFAGKQPYDTWRRDILRDYCEFGTSPGPDGKRFLKCAPEVEARIYASAADFDGLGLLLKCRVPLLVLFGQTSDTQGIAFAEKITAGNSNRRVVVVPQAGHFLLMEKPEEVARLAVEFLGSG